MLNLKIGYNKMEKFVLRTKLVDNPQVVLYYKGTANREGVSLALNTIVVFDMSDAKLFDKADSDKMLKLLNTECELLKSKGFLEFESVLMK